MSDKIASLIVSYSKEPKYIDFNCVCMEQESGLRALKRTNLENGSTAVAVMYQLPFHNPDNCTRHRQHDHVIDDGPKVCYTLSRAIEDELLPVCLTSTYAEAEDIAKEQELPDYQIDLIPILEA